MNSAARTIQKGWRRVATFLGTTFGKGLPRNVKNFFKS
jgi:hypothetical protein